MRPSTMRAMYDLIRDAGLTAINADAIQYVQGLTYDKVQSVTEINSTLNALYINGYLNKQESGWYTQSVWFKDDKNLK
jgi:hypothetical protein